MDTSLILKMKYDNGESISYEEVKELQGKSEILKKLTESYMEDNYFNIYRIVALSEIPYSENLEYTKNVISYISNNLVFHHGFSHTNNQEDIVPCFNAILLEAYIKLGMIESQEVKNALNWIKEYQVFKDNEFTSWKEGGIYKFGNGCIGLIPCYIGIVKTVKALITYREYSKKKDNDIEKLIEKGTNYILQHNVNMRLFEDETLGEKNINNIMFPQSFIITILDLVYIIGKLELWYREETKSLLNLILEKSKSNKLWEIDYIYPHEAFISFDDKDSNSDWINYLFNKFIPKS